VKRGLDREIGQKCGIRFGKKKAMIIGFCTLKILINLAK